jgi:hypothetical protein
MPFPMNYLKFTDKKFATEVCGTSLTEYEQFKEQMQDEAAKEESKLLEAQQAQEERLNNPQRSNIEQYKRILQGGGYAGNAAPISFAQSRISGLSSGLQRAAIARAQLSPQ